MAAPTAGLSRAYAVLRQLEKLREADITDPLLPPSPPRRQRLHMAIRQQLPETPPDAPRRASVKNMTAGRRQSERCVPPRPAGSPSWSAASSVSTPSPTRLASPSSSSSRGASYDASMARTAGASPREWQGQTVVAYVEKIPDGAREASSDRSGGPDRQAEGAVGGCQRPPQDVDPLVRHGDALHGAHPSRPRPMRATDVNSPAAAASSTTPPTASAEPRAREQIFRRRRPPTVGALECFDSDPAREAALAAVAHSLRHSPLPPPNEAGDGSVERQERLVAAPDTRGRPSPALPPTPPSPPSTTPSTARSALVESFIASDGAESSETDAHPVNAPAAPAAPSPPRPRSVGETESLQRTLTEGRADDGVGTASALRVVLPVAVVDTPSPPPRPPPSGRPVGAVVDMADPPGCSSPRERGGPPPPLAPSSALVSTRALPLLAYVEELSGACSPTLLQELASMRVSCADPNSRDAFADCLALTVLANTRGVVRHVVVPLLLEVLLGSSAPSQAEAVRAAAAAAETDPAGDGDALASPRWVRAAVAAESAGTHTATQALCALVGLGDAAAVALPVLVEMLSQGAGPDPRLVAMAVRCVGGPAGVRALEQLVESPPAGYGRAHAVGVTCAALYGLGVMPYPVLGHTTVLCLCEEDVGGSGEARATGQASDNGGTGIPAVGEPLCFYEEPTPDGPYVEMCTEEEGSGGGVAYRRLRTTSTPAALPSSLQVRPPYRPVHVCVRPSVLRERIAAFVASEVFRPGQPYPHLVLVLRDFFLFHEEQRTHRFSPAVVDSLRAAERELGGFLTTVEESLADPTSITMPLLLLPYAYDGCLVRSPDLIFSVERVVLRALVDNPSPAVKAQALVTVGSLPPAARPHAGQPVVDFAIAYARHLDERWAAATDPPAAEGRAAPRSAREAAEEATLVAAAVAVGYAAAPAGPGFASAALEQQARTFLLGLLPQPQPSGRPRPSAQRWRVRHAACVGLGALGVGALSYPRRGASRRSRSARSTPGVALSQESGAGAADEVGSDVRTAPPAVVATREVVDVLVAQLTGSLVAAETACWALVRQGPVGVRRAMALLKDATVPAEGHLAAVRALAKVDMRAVVLVERAVAAAVEPSPPARGGDSLLDDLIVQLTHAIVCPGVLDEEAVVACVYTLAAVVDECGSMAAGMDGEDGGRRRSSAQSAKAWGGQGSRDAPMDPSLDGATSSCAGVAPSDCFLVLRTVLESALLPFAVLRALYWSLCRYGGRHGELYTCQTILESPSVSARAAAAYGLRACGPRAARAIALAMSDDAPEVRRDGFATLEAVGVDRIAADLRDTRRPPEHREQMLAALRDCLLRDLGRGERRAAAQELYDMLIAGAAGTAVHSL